MSCLPKLLLFIASLSCLSACGPNKARQEKPGTASVLPPAAKPSKPEPAYAGYRRYTGHVGGLPVVVELVIADSCAGSYYYQRRGGSIGLRAVRFRPHQPLVLREADGRWEAIQPAGPVLRGTWQGRNGRRLPFALREDYTGAVRYAVEGFSGRGELCSGEEADGIDESNRDTASYGAEYIRLLGPDSLAPAYRRLARALRPPAAPDQLRAWADREAGNSCGSHTESIVVDMNADYLFSFHTLVDEFSFGAAHPDHHCEAVTYDLRTGNALMLPDLLRPGFEQPLRQLLTKILLADPLYKEFFTAGPEREWTDNEGNTSALVPLTYCGVVLTPAGINFIYGSYALGPYVLGMPEILVPYRDLRPLARPSGPLDPLISRAK